MSSVCRTAVRKANIDPRWCGSKEAGMTARRRGPLPLVLAAAVAALIVVAVNGVAAGSARPLRQPAASSAISQLPVLAPVAGCASLLGIDVSQQVGAGTGILSATSATATAGYPICDVKGVIAPQIQFEVQLP